MDIGNNLKNIRKEKGLTQVALSKILNKSESIIQKYESGKVVPSIDILNEISDVLGIHISKLIGNITFGSRLKELREKKQLTESDLAKNLDISTNDISDYEKGKEPDINTLNKIASFFDVTIDYLVGKSDFPNRTDENLIELAKIGTKLERFNTPKEIDIMQEHITTVKKIIDDETSKLNEALTNYYEAHLEINRNEKFNSLMEVISNLIYFTNFIVKLSYDNYFKYSVDHNLMREDLKNGTISPDKDYVEVFNFSRKILNMPRISEKVYSILKELEDEYCEKFDLSANIFVEHSKK